MKALNLRLTAMSLLLALVLLGGGMVLLQRDSLTAEKLPTLAPTLEVAVAQAVNMETSTVTPFETETATATSSMTPTTDTPTETVSATSSPTLAPTRNIPTLPPTAVEVSVPTTEPIVVAPPSEPVPDVVIVRVDPSQLEQLQADVASQGGTVELVDEALGAVTIQLPNADALEEVTQAEYVEASEPDYFVSVQQSELDPLTDQQWSLSAMNIPTTVSADARAIKVAVIDSGVCDTHPELSQKIIEGYDYVQSDTTPQDEMGHGCAVAGIIASAVNGVGMVGVAPNAQLLIYRVLNANGSGRYSHVASAIVRAVDDGAQIINLSLGGANASQLLQDAVTYALERNVLVVAAAGNSGSGSVLYPALYEGVISVGASGRDLNPATFSNYGKIDLWAPGVEVLSLTLQGEYASFNGTSFAAPNVSGLLAHNMGVGAPVTVRGGGFARYNDETVVVAPSPTVVDTVQPTAIARDESLQELYSEIEQNGNASVIVGLNATFAMSGDTAVMNRQQVEINALRDGLIQSLSTYNAEVISLSNEWVVPALALNVDKSALDMLSTSNQISYIVKNGVSYPTMDSSLPAIGVVPTLRNRGFYGAGNANNAVAVLDTGADYDHAFLSGKLISGACFSGANGVSNSLCPNAQTSQTGDRAAHISRCTTLGQNCAHGTHVAGTVVGQNTSGLQGVAPQTKVFPVQVFSRVWNTDEGYYQVLAYDSDIISGLNYVYQQNSSGAIRTIAVNMSLGGGNFSSTCDSADPTTTQIIQLLRTANIATVIAAGNNGFTNQLSWPACISSAVSVGAMTDSFAVASFSNRASFLSVYAPGVSITSAVPGGGYSSWDGTSMAAPHVAGAFALLNPYRALTVDQVLNALRSTGTGIGSYNTPRIRLDLAANMLYPIPINDLVANATTISTTSYSHTMSTLNATNDNQTSCGQGGGSTVWFKYTPPANGTLTLDTIGSNYDTVAAIWTGTPSSLTQIACNDDIVPGSNLASRLERAVNSGTTYYLQLGGHYGQTGNLVTNVRFSPTATTPTPTPTHTPTLVPSPTWTPIATWTPGTPVANCTNNFIGTVNLWRNCALPSEVIVSGNLIINGNGYTLTAASDSRHFRVGSGASLTLNDVTLFGGMPIDEEGAMSDGAISNEGGTLRINRSTFFGNSAVYGGVISTFSSGTTTISYSTFFNNSASASGGAINNWDGGTTTIVDSSFSNNSAGIDGGAINNWGSGSRVTISNTRFLGNLASKTEDWGGGGAFFNGGGGIITVTNSTFYRNSVVSTNAGNPDDYSSGGAINNWGGDNGSTVRINNSIFSGNSADVDGGAIHNDVGGIIEITNSAFSDNSADNAGGSIHNLASTLTITNTSFTRNSADNEGGAIHITENSTVTINGNSTFSNNSAEWGGGISSSSGSTLTVDRSTFSNNNSTGWGGGAILNWGDGNTLRISNTTFSDNSAPNGGGGVIQNGGTGATIEISNSSFLRNTGKWDGVLNNEVGANVAISGSTFSDNVATNAGGVISNHDTLSITNSTFSRNSAPSCGAIYSEGSLTIASSTFSRNSANDYAGVICNNGTLTVSGSSFSNNSAESGGAIGSANNSTLTISTSSFSNNLAQGYGGAIMSYDDENNTLTTITINDSSFINNSALDHTGGAMALHGNNKSTTITNSTFFGNSAAYCGAIDNGGSGVTATIINSTFSGNTAKDGGGLCNYGATLTLNNTILANSLAGQDCWNGGNGTVTFSAGQTNIIETNTTDENACGTTSNYLAVDPNLSNLTNGYFPLNAGSPAIDAGDSITCSPTSQNGVARPFGSSCDIGSYEYAGQPTPTPTPPITPVTAPNPTSPINGAGITTFTPALAWSAVTGATGYEVRYGLSNPPTQVISNLTSTSYTFSQALTTGTFYWQVRAKDRTNNWSAWSSVASFNVNSVAGSAPRPLAQSAGTITLTWNPQSWAQGYQVQVSTNTGFTALVYQSATLPSGTGSDTPTLATGTYYWRVRSLVSGTTWGAWSATETLIVR